LDRRATRIGNVPQGSDNPALVHLNSYFRLGPCPWLDKALDFRNLPAAALDSRVPPLAGDFLEGAAVAIQSGFLATERFPTLHDHVRVLGIKLYPAADALGEFRRGQVVPLPRNGS